MRHNRAYRNDLEAIPLLDREFDNDNYLADLGRRVSDARTRHARRYALTDWLN